MNISTRLLSSSPFFTAPKTNTRAQNIADSIAEANISAAEHRKALAAQQLEALRERLRIMMLFSSASKGNAEAAAKIAREIAAAVKQYADGSSTLTDAGQTAGSDADQKFLSSAKQLSSQVKAIIAAESRKDKKLDKESLRAAVNEMDSAIWEAARVIGKGNDSVPVYTLDMNGMMISTFA